MITKKIFQDLILKNDNGFKCYTKKRPYHNKVLTGAKVDAIFFLQWKLWHVKRKMNVMTEKLSSVSLHIVK